MGKKVASRIAGHGCGGDADAANRKCGRSGWSRVGKRRGSGKDIHRSGNAGTGIGGAVDRQGTGDGGGELLADDDGISGLDEVDARSADVGARRPVNTPEVGAEGTAGERMRNVRVTEKYLCRTGEGISGIQAAVGILPQEQRSVRGPMHEWSDITEQRSGKPDSDEADIPGELLGLDIGLYDIHEIDTIRMGDLVSAGRGAEKPDTYPGKDNLVTHNGVDIIGKGAFQVGQYEHFACARGEVLEGGRRLSTQIKAFQRKIEACRRIGGEGDRQRR